MSTLEAIARERRRLADLLETLDESQWATQSCCGAWTVQEVAAHVLVGPMLGVRGALPFMVRALGRPNEANILAARELAKMGPERLVAELRAHADHRFTPPGFPDSAPLVDIIIHGQDITRPLGLDPLDVPTEHWAHAFDAATSVRYAVVNARSKLKGLSFASSDTDFRWGEGPLVEAPARDLAHAMQGRAAALDDCTGDGVDILRTRLS